MTPIILALTFLAATLFSIGVLRSLQRPLTEIFPNFHNQLQFHGPMAALLIALGTYGDNNEEESNEEGVELGISSKAHALLGLSESQYNRGIVRIGFLFAGLGILFFLALTSYGSISSIVLGVFSGGISAFLVSFSMKDAASRRADEQVRQFPFFLDIFLLTVQSNGSIEDAIENYSSIFGNNEISSELSVLKEDLKSMDIVDSLARLRNRLEHEGLKNNVGDLVQKLRTGARLETSLVQQASEMRILRAELAAQTAERLNVKYRIPVVLCAVACLLIFLAPAIVQISESGLL